MGEWRNPAINEIQFHDPYENITGYEREQETLKKDGLKFSWNQDSIADHPSWNAFTEGFKDENLFALLYRTTLPTEKNQSTFFEPNYSYMEDSRLEPYGSNLDYFEKSTSHAETSQLIRKFHDELRHEANGPAYWIGRVAGGLLDPTALLWFTKAGRYVFTGGRWSTAKRAASMEAGQEVIKHGANPDRTMEESLWITGGAFFFPLILGSGFNKKLTWQQKKQIADDLEDGAAIHDFKGSLNGKPFTYKDGPTNRWRNIDDSTETITINPKVIKPEMKNVDGTLTYKDKTWKQTGAGHSYDEAGNSVVTYNESLIKQMWKLKSYLSPIKGVKVIKNFKSYEQFKEFVINHELTHMFIRPTQAEIKNWKTGGKAAYENRVNKIAWKNTTKKGDMWTHANHLSTLKSKKKLMESINDERFKSTILGKIGEGTNWNPVARIVNSGNLAAIKVMNQVLHLPWIRNKNIKGISTEFAIEEKMALDRFFLGDSMKEIINQWKKWNGIDGFWLWNRPKIAKEDYISLTDFRKRVSLAVIDDTVEDNAQVMAAVHKVKQFYKQWADRIQESKIMERGVERNINFLKERLASVKVNGKILTHQQWKEYKGKGLQTTIRIRDKDYKVAQILKIIDEQEQYFKALKKNVARKNYLNIFVKRDRINADEAAFDAYAFKSIKKSHGDLSDDEIFQIIENLKGEQAWEQIRRTEVNLKKNYDDYNLDIVLNPVGLSGHLKARKLNLDYAQWMRDGWIEDDIMALMQVYNRSVGPDVHLAQVFGDQTMWGGHFGKNIGIGEVIAEYKFKFRKARGDKKKQKAIQEEAEKIVRDLEAARDLIRGTYGVPPNPSRIFSKATRIAKNFNAVTQLTGALAALPDMARMVMTSGFRRSLGQMYEQYSNKQWKAIMDMGIREARLSGESWDILLGTRAMAYADLDDVYGVFNKFEKGFQKFTAASFVINLMSPWNQWAKAQAALHIQSRIIEESQNWTKGLITDNAKMKLAASGIDEKMARRIAKQYEKHGHGKTGKYNDLELDELRLSQSELWSGTEGLEAAKALRLATQRDVNITIVTPNKGDTPLWMSTEAGSLIAQYKKFGMGAFNRMFVRGLQEKDASFFGGLVALLAMGMIVDMVRHKAFNRDYSKTKLPEKLVNGIDRSGMLGIFMDVNNSIERLANNKIGLRAILGANRPYGTDSFDKAGAILGPTVGQFEKLYNITTDSMSGNYNHHTARNVRRLIPLQNIFYLDGIFDSFEKGIK